MNPLTKNSPNYVPIVFLGIALGIYTCPWSKSDSAWAKTSPQTEIHITLLGQPCLLQGPFDEFTLKTIHSIGPAQLYPVIALEEIKNSKKSAQKAIEKLRLSSSLPSLLDRYKAKLTRRLEAQIGFLDAIETLSESGEYEAIIKMSKNYLKKADYQKLKNKVIALKPSSKSLKNQDKANQLFDFYNDLIEPDPEEEFHRAIKKLNIQYRCSFEDSEELVGD